MANITPPPSFNVQFVDKNGKVTPAFYRWLSSNVAGQVTAKASGTVNLSSGVAMVTIPKGCNQAICTDSTSANPVSGSISGTTLTITGTGSDVIHWMVL